MLAGVAAHHDGAAAEARRMNNVGVFFTTVFLIVLRFWLPPR
jgi:hypothetical protein